MSSGFVGASNYLIQGDIRISTVTTAGQVYVADVVSQCGVVTAG